MLRLHDRINFVEKAYHGHYRGKTFILIRWQQIFIEPTAITIISKELFVRTCRPGRIL